MRNNTLRGQVATEFFIYTAVFMFVVIAAFFVVNQVQSVDIPLRENTIARDTGEFFSNAISLAVRGGAGFTYNYTFPTTILGNPYTLSFSNDKKVMVLDWVGRYGTYSQSYNLPSYEYDFKIQNNCIRQVSQGVIGTVYLFNSSDPACSGTLTLGNNGTSLKIFHGGK